MPELNKRVQAVLSEKQYKALEELSGESGKPVSRLIREAIEQVYFAPAQRERRRAALARLVTLNAPVDDWETMEDEIIRGSSS